MSPTSTSGASIQTDETLVSKPSNMPLASEPLPAIISTVNNPSSGTEESEIEIQEDNSEDLLTPDEDASMEGGETYEASRSDKQINGVDILSRIFPSQRRGVLDLVLNGCGGDLLRAIEHFLSVSDSVRKPTQQSPGTSIPRLPVPDPPLQQSSSPPKPSLGSSKSAFTPLVHSGIPAVSHHSPPGYIFPRPPVYNDHFTPRTLSGPPMLPLGTGYPSLLPPLLPCLPPLSFPRHFAESTDEHRPDLQLEPLRPREASFAEYTTRMELFNRPDLRLGLDIRAGTRLRTPESEETT